MHKESRASFQVYNKLTGSYLERSFQRLPYGHVEMGYDQKMNVISVLKFGKRQWHE